MKKQSMTTAMRFFISLAVAILLSLSATAQSGTSGSLTWELANDSTLTIGGTGTVGAGGPWDVYKDKIKSIVIGDGITGIVGGAFANYNALTSVYIGKGFKNFIGCYPFDGDLNLTSLVVDDENPYYVTEDGMLLNKEKTELWDYPKGREGHVEIPPTVVEMSYYMFESSKITSVTIPGSIKEIPICAFLNCTGLKSVTIKEGVQIIEQGAFASCIALSSITIPESVVSIGDYAFTGCAFTSLNIPKNVANIREGAFCCPYLASITVDKANVNFLSEGGVLFNKNKTRLIRYAPGKQEHTYTIPSSVNRIDQYAFEYCYNLSFITVPESVTSIGMAAFNGTSWENTLPKDGCVYINKVLYVYKGEMPANTMVRVKEGTLSISGGVFMGLNGLTSIDIPNSVKSIENENFHGCKNLTSVSIGNGITSLGWGVFTNCDKLKDIYIRNTTPPTLEILPVQNLNAFWAFNQSACTLHVPAGSKENYQSAAGWKDFGTITEIQTMIVSDQPAGTNSTGKIKLTLAIPTDARINKGTFSLTLPQGIAVDIKATELAENYTNDYDLSIENKSGKWLFIIQPNGLRSASTATYQNVLDIFYTVDKSVNERTYEADINDLNFKFSDGTDIIEPQIPIVITVDHSYVGIPNITAATIAYISDNILAVDSPIAETVHVYSLSGLLLHNFQKPAGETSYPINPLQGSVLIIKGSSGWVKKVIAN